MRFIILISAVLLLSGCFLAPGLDITGDSPISSWRPGAHDRIHTIPITGSLIAEQLRHEAGEKHNSAGNHMTDVAHEAEYRVSPHDVLQITVWNHPELTNPAGELGLGGGQTAASPSGRVVRSDGTIFYPYVGVVHVAGKTVEEIRRALSERLKGYIESPQVDVSVAKFRGQLVYVTGEVRQPGVYPISDQGMTVLDAVNLAGGAFHQAAGAASSVSSSLPFTPDLGHVTVTRHGHVRSINLRALLKRGDVSQNMRLQAGDIVHVPSNYRNKVFVLGEVGTQKSLVLTEGRMSLTEAISEAGGFNQTTSNPANVFVIRSQAGGNMAKAKRLAIYHLDAESADAILLADQFELKARDIVYVSTAAIVRWGRVLNQLGGTIQAVNLGIAATRGR